MKNEQSQIKAELLEKLRNVLGEVQEMIVEVRGIKQKIASANA